ncbi:MAG: amidohydrolase family protein [Leadbetterella sp.]|nr:amidohydrolase family protein [Leadbetterella sp.]
MGTTREIQRRYKAKETLDAGGKPVYPGFYDAHAHFPSLAEFLGQADLNGSGSFEEVVERLKAWEQKNPGKAWIIGGGWDQNLWPGKQFPTKDLLDKAFPDKAVFLSRVDYHAAVVNSKALALNKNHRHKGVPGGLIQRKRQCTGRPAGRQCHGPHPYSSSVGRRLPEAPANGPGFPFLRGADQHYRCRTPGQRPGASEKIL